MEHATIKQKFTRALDGLIEQVQGGSSASGCRQTSA
jgi:hypothetical protein